MRGFDYIPGGIGLECLLFPTNWFTRAIRAKNGRARAVMQIEVEHQHGRLLWMLPTINASESENMNIVKNMLSECGRRRLFYIIGSIDEDSPYIDLFKKYGFSHYGWEQVWQYFPQEKNTVELKYSWKKTEAPQLQQINQLHNKILPPKEKTISKDVLNDPPRYCLLLGEEVVGYAYTTVYLDQAVVTPFISHKILHPEKYIFNLLNTYFSNLSFLYIIQRSTQHLSETSLSEKCKKVSSKRQRIVKHLAIRNKDIVAEYNHSANGRKTNIVTPISKQ